MIKLEWDYFKPFVDQFSLSIQYIDYTSLDNSHYYLRAKRDPFDYCCIVNSGTDEFTEFVDDYKDDGNLVVKNDVRPHTPANEHELTPLGLGKKHITNASYCSSIDLSNKSTNTFDYSNCNITPEVGACITDDSYQNRYFVTAVDTENTTLTIEDATGLNNGTSKTISNPCNCDYKLPTSIDSAYQQYHQLWGVRVSTDGSGEDDFGRCKIVDVDNILGYGAGTVVSYYDETWIKYFDIDSLFRVPDNSPGPVIPGLYFRLVYFVTQTTGTTKVWWDYLTTYRDA